MLPVPTIAYLAQFTGRPEESFGIYADQALVQATLLFSLATDLEDYPDREDHQTLAINAILEMADRIYLEQPYQTAKASPYQSESIGSYSYAKGSTAARAKEGQPTGLMWWDLAIDELALADRSIVASSSVSVFERDAISTDADDNRLVVSPGELAAADPTGYVNAELNPRPRLG